MRSHSLAFSVDGPFDIVSFLMVINTSIRYRSVLLTALPITLTLLWVFWANSGPVQWFDNGYLLTRASDSPVILWSQSHASHPFYHAISVLTYRLAGPHGVAYLNAALSIPLAICIFWLARTLRLSHLHASLATVSVLLTNNVFWSATKVEVYTLHLLLLFGVLTLALQPHLRRWQPLGLGFLAGLAIATHQQTIFLLAPLALWIIIQRPRWIMGGLTGLMVGLWPLLPPLFTAPTPLWDTIRHLAYGYQAGHESELVAFRFDRIAHGLPHVALLLVSLVGLPIGGLLAKQPTTATRLLWWTGVVNGVFSISLNFADRFQFFLPGAALFALLGTYSVCQAGWFRRHTRLGPVILIGLVCLAPCISIGIWLMQRAQWIVLPQHRFSLPYRHNTRYFMVPYLKDTSARQFVERYQTVVPIGAMVAADYSILAALRSAQVAGLFQGRDIVDMTLLAPDDTVRDATAIHSRDGATLLPLQYADPATPTVDPREILKETVYGVRFESVLAPWYHLVPQPIGWVGHKK